MRLTDLEQVLLLAVLRLGSGVNGGEIQNEVATAAHRKVSLGSIHVTLGRLEERGLVESRFGEPRGVRGGKARRIYDVTDQGRTALEWNRKLIDDLWDGIPAEGT